MKSNNTIHINGKLYDARTGELIDKIKSSSAKTLKKLVPSAKPSTTKAASTVSKKRGNGFVDGIAKNPNSVAKPHTGKASVKKVNKVPTKPKTGVTHVVAPVHRTLKHSSTLNRSGVRAPRLSSPDSKVHQTAEKKTSKAPLKRLERAQSTHKSEIISRFSRPKTPTSINSSALSDKKPELELSMKNVAHAAEKSRSAGSNHKLINESLTVDSSAPKKIKTPKVKHNSKIFHFMSAGLAVIVLLGYVTYLNVPSVSMKVASSRAGFSATLPSQTPAGYKMQGPIAYSPGQVVMKFGSNTDDRHFTVQQQPTSWDSEALKENFVAKESNAEPLTYNDRGLTIFLYNGGDAAWVDGGKFYSIKAENSQLDTNQVLDLATSM